MTEKQQIWRIAVPVPLNRLFDYLAPADAPAVAPIGARVSVPFKKAHIIGVLCGTSASSSVERKALKRVKALLDQDSILPRELLDLLEWASAYYQHALGEVLFHALPALLRLGRKAAVKNLDWWMLRVAGESWNAADFHRAPRQLALLNLLRQHPDGLPASGLDAGRQDWRGVMRRLVEKGWVEHQQRAAVLTGHRTTDTPPSLNAAQGQAVERIASNVDAFQTFLLEGVTGSGKTEVYLQLVDAVLARGRQVLVLVPEIGLTPQLVARFTARFDHPVAVVHSGLNDQERLNAWCLARDGAAAIIIGTRSAVFTPLALPGLIIVDEEHDLSYKQQDGFRYHARDLAVWRARRLNIPIVLGSATPSLESLYNVEQRRYQHVQLPQRAGQALMPAVRVIDVRGQVLQDSLSPPMLQAIRDHLNRQGQVLLFLNRRGFAPTLLCHECGWVARCDRCDSHMTLYQSNRRLRCHHCGAERRTDDHCPGCASAELRPVGYGTERTEQSLRRLFPQTGLVRIDRDSTRRKGALEDLLSQVQEGRARILVGTQMLAKGHHFPQVTLVCIVDMDQGLFSLDFRATERMAQLIVQVAGRAGRADKPGEVLIQTHHPDHPLLQILLQQGYPGFARSALAERQAATWPPYSHLALLRAEAADRRLPMDFLQQAQASGQGALRLVQILGPLPSPMEKRAGRYRAQLLLQAGSRAQLQGALAQWLPLLETLPAARRVRWSIDVDPLDMY